STASRSRHVEHTNRTRIVVPKGRLHSGRHATDHVRQPTARDERWRAVVSRRVAVILAAFVVLAGLALGGAFSGSPSPKPPQSSAAPGPLPSAAVKPIIRGLIDRQGPPPKAML